jgi:hypothetical protein
MIFTNYLERLASVIYCRQPFQEGKGKEWTCVVVSVNETVAM